MEECLKGVRGLEEEPFMMLAKDMVYKDSGRGIGLLLQYARGRELPYLIWISEVRVCERKRGDERM